VHRQRREHRGPRRPDRRHRPHRRPPRVLVRWVPNDQRPRNGGRPMTRSGQDYLDGLDDGRRVYIDGELVDDIRSHPAFAGAVASVAKLYDVADDPAHRDLLTFTSPTTGEPVNRSYQIPRSEQDL